MSLLNVVALALVLLYIFSMVAFAFFRDDFQDEQCQSLSGCFTLGRLASSSIALLFVVHISMSVNDADHCVSYNTPNDPHPLLPFVCINDRFL